MVSSLLARCIIVTIGTLYPGYRSYKSLIAGDLNGIVQCVRYWIVFSLFVACETITDIFLSWFPFYYWIKIFFVFWMVSPMGSKLLYKRFVRPLLKEREQEIDQLIEQTKQKGYSTLCELTSKSLRYASNVVFNTAVLGQEYLGEHLKRSLSTSDITNNPIKVLFNPPDPLLEEDEELEPKTTKPLKEYRGHASKPNGNIERRTRSNQREKSDNSTNDRLTEYKVPPNLPRKQKRVGTKATAATVYSSNESAHFGTISKGQMKTTTKRSVVHSSPPPDHDTDAADDTD